MPIKKKVTEKPMTLSLRAGKAVNDRQMIPADNVDADGTAWATVGENIRHGAKDAGYGKEMIDAFVSAVLGTDSEVVTIECDISSEKITYSPKHDKIEGGINVLFVRSPFMLLAVNTDKVSDKEQTISINYGIASSSCYIKLREAGYKSDTKIKLTLGIAKT